MLSSTGALRNNHADNLHVEIFRVRGTAGRVQRLKSTTSTTTRTTAATHTTTPSPKFNEYDYTINHRNSLLPHLLLRHRLPPHLASTSPTHFDCDCAPYCGINLLHTFSEFAFFHFLHPCHLGELFRVSHCCLTRLQTALRSVKSIAMSYAVGVGRSTYLHGTKWYVNVNDPAVRSVQMTKM